MWWGPRTSAIGTRQGSVSGGAGGPSSWEDPESADYLGYLDDGDGFIRWAGSEPWVIYLVIEPERGTSTRVGRVLHVGINPRVEDVPLDAYATGDMAPVTAEALAHRALTDAPVKNRRRIKQLIADGALPDVQVLSLDTGMDDERAVRRLRDSLEAVLVPEARRAAAGRVRVSPAESLDADAVRELQPGLVGLGEEFVVATRTPKRPSSLRSLRHALERDPAELLGEQVDLGASHLASQLAGTTPDEPGVVVLLAGPGFGIAADVVIGVWLVHDGGSGIVVLDEDERVTSLRRRLMPPLD